MSTLYQYIYDKVNDGTDKKIPLKYIPDGIKKFWVDWYYSHEGKKAERKTVTE